MGNSALGGSVCNGLDFPCQLKLGRVVAIKVIQKKEIKKEDEYENEDERPINLTKVVYTVTDDWSKSELAFRISDNSKIISFTLRDHNKTLGIHAHFTIRKVEPNSLETSPLVPMFDYAGGGRFKFISFEKTCDYGKSTNEWRGITENSFLIYESDRKAGGLVVVERKKKSKDRKPLMVTVAHYYFLHDFDVKQYTVDIGLSVIVKFESLKNMGLSYTSEGPTQHPGAALVYMIDEVRRTGIWSPTTCPHCATLEAQQSSRAKGPFSRRAINNDGTFNGDGSGNIIEGDWNQFTIYRK